MIRLVERALKVAETQIGVREIGTSNSGPQVDQYIRRVGLRPPASWCAAFAYWCIDEAAVALDVPNPMLRTGYCPFIDHWARQEEILHDNPKPGDLFLIYGERDGEYRAHHTGFIARVHGGITETVEGNTNLAGSSNGIGVFRRTRYVTPAIRFVRWADLVDEDEAPAPWALFLNQVKIADMFMRNGRNFAPVREWANALGFRVDWNNQDQALSFNGKPVETQVLLVDGKAYAPIRDLAQSAGLRLAVNNQERRVTALR